MLKSIALWILCNKVRARLFEVKFQYNECEDPVTLEEELKLSYLAGESSALEYVLDIIKDIQKEG